MSDKHVVILGAGPAGLAAAHELVKLGVSPLVLEKSDKVGGIARTETYKDYYFDIGGHRFFTKIELVNRLWQEMMGGEFLKVSRLSRIFYQGRFFNYPLNIRNTLSNLGISESLLILMSYCKAQISPSPEEETFEQWVSNRFGRRLFETFFKTYTEKVWGIPCDKIQADWAAQRIKGLSLISAVSNALFGTKTSKSLIDEFDYPRLGPGMMWQRLQGHVEAAGGKVLLNMEALTLHHEKGRITRVAYVEKGEIREVSAEQFISSIPITVLVARLEPKAPVEVLEAASSLSYRAFIIVVLIIDKEQLFPDQWIYVHSQDVMVGRIQNFKNWSAAMVPDSGKTSIGMEYFCNADDPFWLKTDAELTEIASRELSLLGLAHTGDVVDSFIVRQPYAYPVYDSDYSEHLSIIRDFIDGFGNLQTIGRSGMHRYNNMDHSMMTGILAAQNVMGTRHNLWGINEESEYLEEGRGAGTEETAQERVLLRTFARMDKPAFAIAVGTVSGFVFFLATIWLVIKGGDVVGPHLRLLRQYFAGYTVTVRGSFIAFGYSFLWGFLFGWLFAYIRNLFLAVYIYRIKKKTELLSLNDFFDHL